MSPVLMSKSKEKIDNASSVLKRRKEFENSNCSSAENNQFFVKIAGPPLLNTQSNCIRKTFLDDTFEEQEKSYHSKDCSFE